MTELRLPVRLEVLQSSIEEVEKVLSRLQPESNGWKELSKYLASMKREANDLSSIFSKPFGSQNQFNNATKDINRIDTALSKMRITMGSIKFSDIKLDSSQLEEFNQLQQSLASIQNEINVFKNNLKQNLQLNDIWDTILTVDPNAVTHSFDQIVKAVENKVSSLERETSRAKETLQNFSQTQAKIDVTKQFFANNGQDALTIKGLGQDIYNQFFAEIQGKLRFKSGQKGPFYEWIQQNLLLDQSEINELIGKTASDLSEAIKSLNIGKILSRATKAEETGKGYQNSYDTKSQQFEQAKQVASVLGTELDKVSEKQASFGERTAIAEQHLNNFTNRVTEGTRALPQFSNGANQLKNALNYLSTSLEQGNAKWLQMQRITNSFNSMKTTVANFMGFTQVLNLTKRAVREAMTHIQQLDSVMNKISIVTEMSTGDLWKQVDTYSQMAQSYGVSIKGAYEVSQIYYQQGLQTRDVMTLTNETLKLAKISGLDYATTTDYMTTALRGFKMEMSEAATVVDVYSNLAAHTAVSQEELAVAMSKTASSMESVGSTFQETSAMIGTMVAVTRESATNIGSAMKSIASRYGELTKDPTKLVDEEGEAMAFNKVDAALQSVGISMKTVDGQFRDFTDVIVELGEKWDQLDSTQQRYIATQFAGNRQQSRFLALVSNVDLLKSNMDVAMNSEDTGTLQALKALDSIESKLEQVKVAYQQFYTTLGAENVWKTSLDGIRNYIEMLNNLPKLFGKIPIGAAAMIANLVEIVRAIGSSALERLGEHLLSYIKGIDVEENLTQAINGSGESQKKAEETGANVGQGYVNGIERQKSNVENAGRELGEAGITGLNTGAGTHSPSVPAGITGDNVGQGFSGGMERQKENVEAAGKSLGEAGITGLNAGAGSDFSASALSYNIGASVGLSLIEGALQHKTSIFDTGKSLAESMLSGINIGFEKMSEIAALATAKLIELAPAIRAGTFSLNNLTTQNIREQVEQGVNLTPTQKAAHTLSYDNLKQSFEAEQIYKDVEAINQKIAAYEQLKLKQWEVKSLEKGSDEYKTASAERNTLAKSLGTSWNVNANDKIKELSEQKALLEQELATKLPALQILAAIKISNFEEIYDKIKEWHLKIPAEVAVNKERASAAAAQAINENRERVQTRAPLDDSLIIPTVRPARETPIETIPEIVDHSFNNDFKGNHQQQVDLINAQIDALERLRQAREQLDNAQAHSDEKRVALDNFRAEIENVKPSINEGMFSGGILSWKTSLEEIDNVIEQYKERLSNFITHPIDNAAGEQQIAFDFDLLGVPKVQVEREPIQQEVTAAVEEVSQQTQQIPMDIAPHLSTDTNGIYNLDENFEEGLTGQQLEGIIQKLVSVKVLSGEVAAKLRELLSAGDQQGFVDLYRSTLFQGADPTLQIQNNSKVTPAWDERVAQERARVEAERQQAEAERQQALREKQESYTLNDSYLNSLEEQTAAEETQQSAIQRTIAVLKEKASAFLSDGKQLSTFGSALSTITSLIDKGTSGGRVFAGAMTAVAGTIKTIGALMQDNAWMALATGIVTIVNGVSTAIETSTERLERLTKEAEELNNTAKEKKSEYNLLQNNIDKIEELNEKRYESAEAAKEYQTAVDDLAEKFPEMIAGFDEAGNIILDTTDAERILAEARKESAAATLKAAEKEFERAKDARDQSRNKLAGRRIGSIKASDYETQRAESIQQLLQNWLGLTEAEAGEIAGQTSIENKYEFLRRYEHTGSGQFINDYSTLDEARKYLEDNYKELTPNQKTFYDLFFGAKDSPEQLIEEYTKVQEELNELLDKPTEQNRSKINSKFNELKKLYDEAFVKYSDNDLFDFQALSSQFADVGEMISDWTENTNSTKGYEKELINAWQSSSQANVKAWEVLRTSGEAAAIVTKAIENDLNGEDWDYENATDEQKKTWFNYQASMANFISSLTTDELSQFEKMIGDSSNFTTEDFSDTFKGKVTPTVERFLNIWFANGVTSINERLDAEIQKNSGQQDISNLQGFYGEIQTARAELNDNITTTEENYLHKIIAEYESLSDQGFTHAASDFGTAAISLFKQVNDLSGDIEKTIWATISEEGLTTIEGIKAIKDSIDANEGIDSKAKADMKDSLDIIESTIIPNINLSIQTATSDLLETWADTSSNLTKAMDKKLTLKEANSLIEEASNLGVKIDLNADFTASGDKLILSSEKFSEYWIKLSEANRENAAKWEGKIKQAELLLAQGLSENSLDEDTIRLFSSLGVDILKEDYWDNIGRLTNEGILEIQSLINKSQDGLNNFIWYNQTAAKQLAQAWNWKQGNYFKAIDEQGNIIYDSIVANVNDLINLINQDMESKFSSKTEVAKRDLLDQVYSSYNTLISDIMSKGIENISLDDYEGIINDDQHRASLQAALLSQSDTKYQDFVEAYIQYAGKSIDEANDLLAEAIAKDREVTSSELIGELQFVNQTVFKATLSELKDLANKLNIDLGNILKNAQYNEILDEYIVDATSIEGLDLSNAGFQDKVRSSVQEFFKSLASYISSALKGNLGEADAKQLQDFAHQIDENWNIQFTRTADGFKIANDEARKLVSTVSKLDKIQGRVLFNELKDNLIETDDAFQSASANAAYIAHLGSPAAKLTDEQNKFLESLNGNVDVFNRPVLKNADGTISTLKTITEDSRNYQGTSDVPWVMNITPITPDGRELSDAKLKEYINKLFKDAGGDLSKVLALDKANLGLIIELADTAGKDQEKVLQQYDARAESLHEISALIEQIKEDETFDTTKIDQYNEELQLAKQIQEVRSTTEDDSFNFMSQKIPSGQNNPLNYWSNWYDAFAKMKATSYKGRDRGKMAYEDFYNIVTEMGNIAEISGVAVNIGGRTLTNSQQAADLITEAAGALTNMSTGNMGVKLESIGINFASGVDKMANGVDEGINALADQQINMLDSMIALLETLQGMEQLGDLDLNNDMVINGEELYLELDESGVWIEKYADKYVEITQSMINTFTNDKGEVNPILSQVTANGHTMLSIFQASTDQLKEMGISAKQLETLITNVNKIIKSKDFDPQRPWESFLEIYAQLDWGDVNIGVNTGNYKILLTDEGSYSVEWSSDAAKEKIRGALEEWKNLSDEEISALASEASSALETGKADIKQNLLVKVLTGNIQIKTIQGKKTYFVGNRPFNDYGEAVRASDLVNAGIDVNEIQFEETTAKAVETYDGIEIELSTDGNGKVTYTVGGVQKDSKAEALQAIFEQTHEGASALLKNGADSIEFKKWKVEQGIEVMPLITFNDSEQIATPELQAKAQQLIKEKKFSDLEKELNVTLDPKFENGTASVTDYQELLAAFGIEAKAVDLTANVTATGHEGLVNAIETGTAAIQVEVSSGETPTQNIIAQVIQYVNGPNVDPNTLVNHLQALITSFKGSAHAIVDTQKISNLAATILSYLAADDATVDQSKILDLTATILQYSASDNATVDLTKLANLTATITSYIAAKQGVTVDKDKILGLTATILEYAVSEDGVTVDTTKLQNLTATILNYIAAQSGVTVDKDKIQNLTATILNYIAADQGVTVDQTKLADLTATITAYAAATSGVTVDTDKISLLTATITEYIASNGAIVDNKEKIASLTGTITSFIASDDPTIDNSKIAELVATIVQYKGSSTAQVDQSKLEKLSATIIAYKAATTGVLVDQEKINSLTATINSYIAASTGVTVDKDKISALTATITKYLNGPKVQIPTLDGLTQLINDINTDGADVALQNWRKKQESESIKIGIDSDVNKDEYASIKYKLFTNPNIAEQNLGIELNDNGKRILSNNSEAITDYANSLLNLVESGKQLSTIDKDNVFKLRGQVGDWSASDEAAQSFLSTITQIIDLNRYNEANQSNALENLKWINDLDGTKLNDLVAMLASLSSNTELIGELITQLTLLKENINSIDTAAPKIDISVNSETALRKLQAIISKLNLIKSKDITITTTTNEKATPLSKFDETTDVEKVAGAAKGNVALAKGTLMGELGPELYVTGGRYYIAGRDGAEFVDLPDDAIVFNHLQTRKLMSTGSSSRGTPTTNDRNSIALAHGNWNGGEAKNSLSAAISSLKQLRSAWQSLKDLGAKDLAGAAGSGGGGGSNDDKKAFLKDLEKWYNWLQEIDKLEQHITYQETLRSKIQSDMVAHGQDYFKSELISLDNLNKQVAVEKDLYESQAAYFEKRMAQLNSDSNPFSSLYSFDEQGQLKYKEGKLEQLSYMSGTDEYGKPNMTAEEQYNYIVNTLGIDTSYLKYDDSGNEIKKTDDDGKENENYYTEIVEAFWNKIDADKEEAQTLYDSVQEHKETMVEKQGEINELLQDMEDNTIDLEGKVYDAIVDMNERAIKEFEDTRDQMKENNEALIDGLNKQLAAEKQAYETQESNDELTSLQRRLAILQRSGGSASEIASLEKEITTKQQDMYWESQQAEIDALQEASDTELEKLDAQIDLMTETLAYQKENGLLNAEVYKQMLKSPEEIANFIQTNNSEYWGKTPQDLIKTTREDLFSAQRWTEMLGQFGGIDKLIEYYTKLTLGQEGNDEKAQEISDEINGTKDQTQQNKQQAGTANGSTSNVGVWKQDEVGWWYDLGEGKYPSNAWKKIDGRWYHFDDRGYMQVGWFQDTDGAWYYLGADGAMVADTTKELEWDGTLAKHTFDASGKWIGQEAIAASQNKKKHGWKYTLNYWENGEVQSVEASAETQEAAEKLAIKKIPEKLRDNYWIANTEQYESGGMNEYTGLAKLHGTKSKPEAVLNASQTHILRDEILSNKPDSLLSLLSDWRAAQSEMQKLYDINNNTSSISIEKAEVIMQVQHMNNDYDAQRAGDQALEQIMKIARKSIAQNRIGR